jgi:hypothetical protein
VIPYPHNRISGIITEGKKEDWTINPSPFNPCREETATSVIRGTSLCTVAVIIVLAKDRLSVAPWIIAVHAIMGIVLGFFG